MACLPFLPNWRIPTHLPLNWEKNVFDLDNWAKRDGGTDDIDAAASDWPTLVVKRTEEELALVSGLHLKNSWSEMERGNVGTVLHWRSLEKWPQPSQAPHWPNDDCQVTHKSATKSVSRGIYSRPSLVLLHAAATQHGGKTPSERRKRALGKHPHCHRKRFTLQRHAGFGAVIMAWYQTVVSLAAAAATPQLYHHQWKSRVNTYGKSAT